MKINVLFYLHEIQLHSRKLFRFSLIVTLIWKGKEKILKEILIIKIMENLISQTITKVEDLILTRIKILNQIILTALIIIINLVVIDLKRLNQNPWILINQIKLKLEIITLF